MTPTGVDAVWLMGVWQRSPAGVQLALDTPEQVASFHQVLPDLTDADVIGSAYCIAATRSTRASAAAPAWPRPGPCWRDAGSDCWWTSCPTTWPRITPGSPTTPSTSSRAPRPTSRRIPQAFLPVGDTVIARGRDPYFPPWPDVAQLNAFDPGMRRAAADTLIDIGSQADGVRCDMAMLLRNEVFARTWGERAGPPPDEEYWTEVLGAVRAVHPDFLFAAEAYWDMEWDLQQLGFDHCYDKRLYDRLVHEGPGEVRGHLDADLDYQTHLLRFIENHDEPRAAATFTPAAERAAAVAMATLPGATLWHEGQFEGWKVRLPVFLGRRPVEPVDEDLRAFHLRLVAAAAQVRRGRWQRCETSGWPEDQSHDQLAAWCWSDDAARSLVVVNLADAPAAAHVHLPWPDLAGPSLAPRGPPVRRRVRTRR